MTFLANIGLCFVILVAGLTAQVRGEDKNTVTMEKNIHASLAEPQPPPAPMPPALQGVWASPDCGDPQKVLVFSAFHILHQKPNLGMLHPVFLWRTEPGDGETYYYYMTGPYAGYTARMTNDGLMKHVSYLVHPRQPIHSVWGRAVDFMSDEFSRCAKVFSDAPAISQYDVNIPFLLDRVQQGCAGVSPDGFHAATSCHETLFKVADSDGDHAIAVDDLLALHHYATVLERAMPQGCGTARAPTPAPQNPGTGRTFAHAAITYGDSDKDGVLDIREALALMNNPLAAPALAEPLTRLRAARSLLPFLPLTDAERSCASGANAEPQAYTGMITSPDAPSPLELDSPAGAGGCAACAAAPSLGR